jgi:transposase
MPTARHTETPTAVDSVVKRRFRTKQERRQIAEESLRPGASVAVVARRHGVNANQVFLWRRLLRDGMLDAEPAPAHLMPVRIAELLPIEADSFVRPYPGTIHIELGKARVRLEGSVDPGSLRLILEHLGR